MIATKLFFRSKSLVYLLALPNWAILKNVKYIQYTGILIADYKIQNKYNLSDVQFNIRIRVKSAFGDSLMDDRL